jgi:hypothetical protein
VSSSEQRRHELTLRTAVEHGVGWVERQLQPDGSLIGSGRDLAGYHKSLLALALCGRLESASRCRSCVRRACVGPHADLSSGDVKTGIVRMARNLAHYMDGWVAIGVRP